MCTDLQIKQTPSNLPMSLKPLFGRQADIDAVCSLLQQPQRIVVMTGCPGTGKASLALAVASRLVADQLVPFVIDARGAPTCEGVLRRLLQVFDVRFKLREMTYFCNWLNSQEQSPLIVINNVEIVQDEDTIFSDLLDRLVSGVKNARIICTSGRNFYSGKTPCQLYKVADLGSSTKRVVLSLAPDLHEEGVDELCKACDNVLLGVYLTAKSCTLPEVDPGQLFVDVTTFDNGIFEPAKVWDLAGMGASDEDTRRKLAKVMAVIERVILNLPQSHQTVLTTSSMFACYFDVSVCCHMSGLSEPEVKQVLKELVETGFVLTETHKNKPCYYVESFVKHVARAICFANRGDDALLKYCGYFVNQLKSLCSRFWSPSVSDVVNEFDENFDNFIDVIEHTIDRDNLLSQIAEASQIENIIFYATVLPDKLYLMMYDALAQVADTNNDVQTMADSFCALSYYYVETGKPERARSFALRAFELLQNAPAGVAEKLDKTLCWQSLGRALWHEVEEKTRALMLLKRAQEVTHATKGVRHLKTLIANEFYAALLTQTENFQMARHYYNISDMALRQLQEHPFFLPGFECRRIIWDKLNLFQRSTDMSLKSSTVTQRYHGDHPLTATAYTRYCDCLLRQGSIQEAIKACINALSIRTRVLGNHLDTAFSNKTLAYLLLKCGQPEESMRYCDTALEIYEKLRSDEALKMDVRNIIAQARSRHMAQLTAAARAELTNGYNSLDTSLPSSGGVSTTV